jgi:hypothetical protein
MYRYYYGNPAYLYNTPGIPSYREYPPIDTKILASSAADFRALIKDASQLLDKLAEQPYAHQLMAAAQAGNHHEVDRLIKQAGHESNMTARYTPSGIVITASPKVEAPCCSLVMTLKWGR